MLGCAEPSEDTHGFCTKHADKIFHEICSHAEDVLGIARTVYFGRTSFPERRLLQHIVKKERDHMLVVHWAANWPEAEEFEETLIDAFKAQSKLKRIENESFGSEGAYGSPWNAIYISFALKHHAPLPPGAIDVDRLHWRNRIWPNPLVPNAPILLRSGLTEEQAKNELDRFKVSADPARSRTGRAPTQGPRKEMPPS